MSGPSSSEITCPRCGAPMEGRRMGEAQMAACGRCSALLMKHSALQPALEELSAHVLPTLDPDVNVPALPDRSGQPPCPGCGGKMEKADYCNAAKVFFDRCEPCDLLWIGNEEMGAMSLMWARMERRIARTHAQTLQDLAGLDALWQAPSWSTSDWASDLRLVVNGRLEPLAIGLILLV